MDAGGRPRREQAVEDARSRPAQAGIQAGDAGRIDGWRVLPDGMGWEIPLVVMPAVREGMIKTTGFRPAPE